MGFNEDMDRLVSSQKKQQTKTTKRRSFNEDMDLLVSGKPLPVEPPKQGTGDFRAAEARSGLYTAPKPAPQGTGDFRAAERDTNNYAREAAPTTVLNSVGAPRFKKEHPIQNAIYTPLKYLSETAPGKFINRIGDVAASSSGARTDINPRSLGNKPADIASTLLGWGVGTMAQPGANQQLGALDDVTKVALTKLGTLGTRTAQVAGNGIVQSGVNNALGGGAFNAANAAMEGKSAKDVAKSSGEGMLFGGVLGVGGAALAKGVGAGLSKLGERNRMTPTEALAEVNKAYQGASREVIPTVTPQRTYTLPKFNDEVASAAEKLDPPDVLNERISTPTLRIESTPPVLKEPGYIAGPKERKFSQSVINSQVATNDIKQGLKDNKLTYDPITNKETFDKATQMVKSDYDNALNYFQSPSKGITADEVGVGEALITKAIKEGNHNEANRLISELAEKLTSAGQAVQAASIFKRLTPEGMLLYAQRVINGANKDLLQKLGKKAPKLQLTPDDSEFIMNTMKKVQQLPEGRGKDVELAKVMQYIADKIPVERSEKLKGIQRIALLLNPKTMGRNVIGNTIFGAVDNLSNVVATPIDMLTSKLTGKRTATLPNMVGQFKSGLQGVKEAIEDARLGIDTSPGRTQYELPNKRIFKTRPLNALDKVTKAGLQMGDRPFYKAAYDDVLRQQMKLAKATEPTADMIEQAHAIAEQRTYQDVNALTKAFKKAQSALNLEKDFGLGNIVLPFVKTPANILKRAIEYSPLGIQKAFSEAKKAGTGKFNQRAFVDSIARSVTGTALIMVGYDLAKQGHITGSADKDKDVAAFERNLGKKDFAFKVGDNYYTYDWAQPASMALAVGADMFINGKNRKDAENVVTDAIKSGGETLFKQSLLQGLQRFMGGYSPMDNIENTAINIPNMFIPTLSRQVTQLTDPYERSTYDPSNVGTGVNLVKTKLPGVSKSLPPKVDTFGHEIKNYQGNNNWFNVFVNPGTATKYKPNAIQKEILRVYDTTGNKDIFPKVAPTKFTYKGDKYTLTPKELAEFQRVMGRKTESLMAPVVVRKIPDEAKAKQLAKAIEVAYNQAKLDLIKKRKK